MSQKKLLTKLRQYAKRESLKHFQSIQYEACLLMLLNPKPKWMPSFAWKYIVKLVIKQPDERNNKESI